MGGPGRAGAGEASDFDLRPEGLLDVLCVRVAPRPDGEAAVLPQGRGHGGGVHILRQLAFVSEGVHDRAVCCQLRQRGGSGQAALRPSPAHVKPQPLLPSPGLAGPPPPQTPHPQPLRGLSSGWCRVCQDGDGFRPRQGQVHRWARGLGGGCQKQGAGWQSQGFLGPEEVAQGRVEPSRAPGRIGSPPSAWPAAPPPRPGQHIVSRGAWGG